MKEEGEKGVGLEHWRRRKEDRMRIRVELLGRGGFDYKGRLGTIAGGAVASRRKAAHTVRSLLAKPSL